MIAPSDCTQCGHSLEWHPRGPCARAECGCATFTIGAPAWELPTPRWRPRWRWVAIAALTWIVVVVVGFILFAAWTRALDVLEDVPMIEEAP